MNMLIKISLVSVLGALAFPTLANEVLLTHGGEKGTGRVLALDFLNDGQATAFEMEIAFPEGVAKVDTQACVAELPGTHKGACRFNEKTQRVVVMVYSDDNSLLPKGNVAIGALRTEGLKGSASVEKVLVADLQGNSLPGQGVSDLEGASRAKPANSQR